MSATSTWRAGSSGVLAGQLALDVDEPRRGWTAPQLSHDRSEPPTIVVADRVLHPTAVFDTYWRFAAERQYVYEARLRGVPKPWTNDPILASYRFTNCYRAADRVSQYLIRHVLYDGAQDPSEIVFRALVFKLFNRIQTWELLTSELGEVRWDEFSFLRYDRILGNAMRRGERIYSAAYVMPPPNLGETRKHSNHLRLVERMMASDLPLRAIHSTSLAELFKLLSGYPAIGPFLAFQFAIDLNYSPVIEHDEAEFVAAGPGARDGIEKCFGPTSRGIENDVIRYMADRQEEHFARLGLPFRGLAGLRPLQLIDCQNLFCEVDKYARVAHPEVAGLSGRTRIKQHYRADSAPVAAWFPPKWGLNDEPVAPDRRDFTSPTVGTLSTGRTAHETWSYDD